MREWDCLLTQAELNLNSLRLARVNPKISAYAYLFGQFDCNKTPLVPSGTKVIAQTKVSKCASWELNCEKGWYIDPLPDHYRCIKVFPSKTRAEREVDTVTFFPASITFPEIKLDDFLLQAADDIITVLTQPPSSTTPTLQAGDLTKNTLLELAKILNQADDLPQRTSVI